MPRTLGWVNLKKRNNGSSVENSANGVQTESSLSSPVKIKCSVGKNENQVIQPPPSSQTALTQVIDTSDNSVINSTTPGYSSLTSDPSSQESQQKNSQSTIQEKAKGEDGNQQEETTNFHSNSSSSPSEISSRLEKENSQDADRTISSSVPLVVIKQGNKAEIKQQISFTNTSST